VDLNVEGLAGF